MHRRRICEQNCSLIAEWEPTTAGQSRTIIGTQIRLKESPAQWRPSVRPSYGTAHRTARPGTVEHGLKETVCDWTRNSVTKITTTGIERWHVDAGTV